MASEPTTNAVAQVASVPRDTLSPVSERHHVSGGKLLPPEGPGASQARHEHVGAAQLSQAVSHLNAYVQQVRRELQFSIDAQTGVVVVKVLDASSDKVIRQIPPQDVLDLAHSMERIDGLIFRARA